jgi:hypothetical protein
VNEILLNNQVIVYLLSESILFVLLAGAFALTVEMLLYWDFGSFTQRQYRLERRAYLVMTIVLFAFFVKFLLLAYFVFALDSLAVLVPGAMCAAGVISANGYGMPLLFLKLVILFAMLLWMRLNAYDLEAKEYPLFRAKSWLFAVIFLLVALETGLDFAYFVHIDPHRPVSCCSSLYGQLEGANPLPFGLQIASLLLLFYLLYAVLAGALALGQRFVTLVAAPLFVVIAYYAVVYFFGTYVYALPTHKCPFCMLQKEYGYVGYLIWGSLFGGVFLALIASIMEIGLKKPHTKERKSALILLSAFVLLCTAYVAFYYLKNGVLL